MVHSCLTNRLILASFPSISSTLQAFKAIFRNGSGRASVRTLIAFGAHAVAMPGRRLSNRCRGRQDPQMDPRPPLRMEQESIPSDPAHSGRLGDESELQPAFARIVNDPALESESVKPLQEIDTHFQHMIVRVTALGAISRLIPDPLIHCGHVMTDDDGGDRLWHRGCKEAPLPVGKALDGDCAHLAA